MRATNWTPLGLLSPRRCAHRGDTPVPRPRLCPSRAARKRTRCWSRAGFRSMKRSHWRRRGASRTARASSGWSGRNTPAEGRRARPRRRNSVTRLSLSAGRDSVTSALQQGTSGVLEHGRETPHSGRGNSSGFADQPQPETGTVCRRGSGDRHRDRPERRDSRSACTRRPRQHQLGMVRRSGAPSGRYPGQYRAVERARAQGPHDRGRQQRSRRAEQRPASSSKKPLPGYNPYDRGEPTKQSRKKKRDLREFSKWIALKKRMRDKPGEG